MISLGLQIFDGSTPEGKIVADWSSVVEDLEIAKGKGGSWYVSGFVPMPIELASKWYQLDKFYHLKITPNVWAGRLTRVRLVERGIEFIAKGYYQSLRDLNMNAFWSTQNYGLFRVLDQEDVINADPGRAFFDFNNRIYIAIIKDSEIDSSHWAGVGFRIPSSGFPLINRISFDYEYLIPAGIGGTVDCRERLFDWSNVAPALWTATTTGSVQTGSQTISISGGAEAISFMAWRSSATPATYTGETGEFYLKITNLRMYGRDGTEVRPDHIIDQMVASINNVNPDMLKASTHAIDNPGIDLTEVIIEDQKFVNVLEWLVELGDTNNNKWEAGVNDERYLYYRQRGQGNTYYVYVDDYAIAADLENYYNVTYAIYRYPDRHNRRTATAIATDKDTFGTQLADFVNIDTTNTTLAEDYRDTHLADSNVREPITAITVTRLFDEKGISVPLWFLQPGDTVAVRNVTGITPGDLSPAKMVVESLIIRDGNNTRPPELRIEPRKPEDAVDFLIARRSAGLR